jgi:uncharacterized protein (TIGR03435 family)
MIKDSVKGILQLRAGSVSMAQFLSRTAAEQKQELGEPAIDRTGIAGLVDIELDYVARELLASPEAAGGGPNGQSFVAAVRNQLGLTFDRSRERVSVLVIDRVQAPSPN